MKLVKFAPWVLNVILVVALVSLYIAKNTEIEAVRQQHEVLLSQYNTLVAEANQLISVANLPEATVAITFRSAVFGSGYVAIITNTSAASIPVTIEARRPSTGQMRNFDYVIDGGAFSEIGHMEGWAFVSGDIVTVKQPNHKPKASTL